MKEPQPQGGWNGYVRRVVILAQGRATLEFGTDKRTKAKADKDYNNRAKSVDGKSEEIPVFATPRIWRRTAKWVEERRQEGVFASVEAFDAERLEGWLQSTPAVHYWLSEIMDKPVHGAQMLSEWWEIQQHNHGIRVPSELHVLGRDKEVLQLKSVGFPKNPSLLICARSQTDVLAFCYEALRNVKDKPLEHALVIFNVAAWNYLIRCATPLILIPLFENPNIGEALSRKHCVIEPGYKRALKAVGEEVIELADIPASEGRRLLVRAGWKEAEAAAFVGRMQRSGSGLPSSDGRNGVHRVPDWAQSELAAEILAPLILIGAWKDGDPNDEKIVGEYLKKDMDDVRSYLVQQARLDDEKCPVIRWGQVWRFVDRQEAAVYLLPLLGEKQLRNWVQFVENVVVCRPAKSVVSEELLHSMLQGLAIIASVDSELLNNNNRVSRSIDKIVDSILEGAAKGDSETPIPDPWQVRSIDHNDRDTAENETASRSVSKLTRASRREFGRSTSLVRKRSRTRSCWKNFSCRPRTGLAGIPRMISIPSRSFQPILNHYGPFYLNRGYLEFNVESTQVSISPDKKDVFISVSVTEGERYVVSSIKLAGDLTLSEDELRKSMQIKAGDVFSREKLNESTKAISDKLSAKGYAFANVNAAPEIDKEKRQVAFTIFVDPGKRVYVRRRINIVGNTKTRDEVIRQEMRQMEGGWYDDERVKLSKQRIDKTDYFSEVQR